MGKINNQKKYSNKLKITISIQILVFLVIISFLPIAGMMILRTYEKQMLAAAEDSMVQQGRFFAAALKNNFSAETAETILQNMNKRFDSRIRVLDARGKLICDSIKTETLPEENQNDESMIYYREESSKAYKLFNGDEKNPEHSFIYKMFSLPVRILRKLLQEPTRSSFENADYYIGKTIYDGKEIISALSGKYGSATRISSGGQRSVTLYSAIPVFENSKVCGVILLSKSTYRILQNLYVIRKNIAKIFLISLIAVAAVAIFLFFRITLPLNKLSREILRCTDSKGHIIKENLTGEKRRDEIGLISNSFSALIKKLAERIEQMEHFSADISHEFKNPLAAIRLSAEMSYEDKYRKTILDEVSHLEQLLKEIRILSQIDGDNLIEKENIPVDIFLENYIPRIRMRHENKEIILKNSCKDLFIETNLNFFERMIENLIENAASFADKILITSCVLENRKSRMLIISVEDSGPGVPLENREKIFNRFYSSRKNKDNHSGLGLAFVKAAAEFAGGKVSVTESQKLGGAKFTVELNL